MITAEERDKELKAIKLSDAFLIKSTIESIIRVRAYNSLNPPRAHFIGFLTAVIRKPLKQSTLKHDLAIEFKNLTDIWENGYIAGTTAELPNKCISSHLLVISEEFYNKYQFKEHLDISFFEDINLVKANSKEVCPIEHILGFTGVHELDVKDINESDIYKPSHSFLERTLNGLDILIRVFDANPEKLNNSGDIYFSKQVSCLEAFDTIADIDSSMVPYDYYIWVGWTAKKACGFIHHKFVSIKEAEKYVSFKLGDDNNFLEFVERFNSQVSDNNLLKELYYKSIEVCFYDLIYGLNYHKNS